MKNIISWSFGAFFKTLGRILAYLLVGFLLAIICSKLGFNFGYIRVNASTSVNQWAEHLPDLTRVNMYECGASKCYDKTTDFGGIESSTGTGDRKYVYSSSKLTVDSLGGTVIQTTTGDVVNAGYLYLTKFYVCFGNSISSYNYKIGTAAYSTPSTFSSDQVMINDLALSTSPGISSSGFSSCRLFSGLYVPKTTGNNWLSIQFTSSTTQTSKFNLIAVETEELGMYTETIKSIVNSSNGQVVDAVDAVKEETKKTNDAITSSSDDDEEESCGIICKLKSIVKFLKPTSLSNLIIPNEDQMHDLMDTMQTQVTSKLGILAFPVTLYTQIINLVQNVSDTNWCIDWDDVTVPNFEDSVIIESGQFCFSTILQNEKVSTFRNSCLVIVGGLILLAFAQFLKNCYNRVLDLPDRDDYTYVTTEDVYSVNSRGEAELKQVRNRSTYREKR